MNLNLKKLALLNYPNPKLLRINFIFSWIVILISIYIILSPLIPQISFSLEKEKFQQEYISSQSSLFSIEQDDSTISSKGKIQIPEHNKLLIPQIGVNAEILEGENPSNTLDVGLWRLPYTSNPEKGGNTVITGHRFQYTSGPNTFYNLDKLKEGDKFVIFWNKKKFVYEIKTILIVEPNEVWIEENISKSQITLYTCTPLWTSAQRLVVIGEEIK